MMERAIQVTNGAGNGAGQAQATVYCIVPRDLAPQLHDALRTHWRDDPGITVVVERRERERRSGEEQRLERTSRRGRERRKVRHATGRRVAERRARVVQVATPALPRKARRHRERLTFVAVREGTGQHLRDVESHRLVVRCQEGDAAAMSELYLRHFDGIYGYARVALRDHHTAEDVTQEVFVRALHALPSYEVRPGTPFRAWLFSIARNAVITTLTQQRRICIEDAHKLELRRAHETSEEMNSVLTWLSDSEVSLFVERLTDPQREVVVLRFMLDLSHDEIAAVTGRGVKAVRQIQSRALSILRDRLVSVGYGPAKSRRVPIRIRMRPLPVLGARRFGLATPLRPLEGLGVHSTYARAPVRF